MKTIERDAEIVGVRILEQPMEFHHAPQVDSVDVKKMSW